MADLSAGFGRAEITPPVGLDLTGFIFRDNPSESVLHPLSARALALECGGKGGLLVSIECLCLEKRLGDALRRWISEDTGIPPESILIMCTHTHSGPATVKLLGCGEMNRPYLRGTFKEGIAAAAREAVTNLAPCEVRYGHREASKWHEYRRAVDRGPSDEDLVNHAVRALWLEDSAGKPMGCFWTYTAHPTILGTKEISGDWVGEAMRRVEDTSGGIAVYGQGCAGDVGPIYSEDRYESIREMGHAIGDIVLDLRKNSDPVSVERIWGRLTTVEVPFEHVPTRSWFEGYAVEMRRETENMPPSLSRRMAAAMAEWASHWATEDPPDSMPATLQCLHLGPFNLVALPFEPLSAIGGEIRQFLGERTIVLGYTHACHSYLAPARQYFVGGYEIHEAYRYYDLPAPWDRRAADIVTGAVLELCAQEEIPETEEAEDVDRPV
jgi:hypothetical protein